MSPKGNPYDNAMLESFMKTLKCEEVYLNEYETEAEARVNIGTFIEKMYRGCSVYGGHSKTQWICDLKFPFV